MQSGLHIETIDVSGIVADDSKITASRNGNALEKLNDFLQAENRF